MDYFIKHIGRRKFTVAKFDSGDRPIDVYHINGDDCDCPSYRKPCKHMPLIAEWLQQEEPHAVFYDDTTQRFLPHKMDRGVEELLQ